MKKATPIILMALMSATVSATDLEENTWSCSNGAITLVDRPELRERPYGGQVVLLGEEHAATLMTSGLNRIWYYGLKNPEVLTSGHRYAIALWHDNSAAFYDFTEDPEKMSAYPEFTFTCDEVMK